MEICSKFFDLEHNIVSQYMTELTSNNIQGELSTIFDDLEDIFNEVIKEEEYEVEQGSITLKYKIMKKKGTTIRSYTLKMYKMKLSREEQLLYLVK